MPAVPAPAVPRPVSGRGPTIRHVAEAAGVSLKTVSRVINADPAVHADTQARVRAVIARLGWQPDPRARSLRGRHAHALGLVYDNPNAHYVVGLQQGVLEACREQGYGLQIHPCQAGQPGVAQALVQLVQHGRLAGLVLAPPLSEDPATLAHLAAAGVAVVRIVSGAEDAPPEGSADVLQVDDRRAARAVVEHLLQLGHERIGFLWGQAGHGSSRQRHAGYRDALARWNLVPDPALELAGEFSFESGFLGARRLLALPQPPTAIFGCNDEIAAGVLAAARAAGLEVPWRLSIAGFEDSPFSRQAWPALTTARQSPAEIGRRAGARLIERVQAEGRGALTAPTLQTLVPELVVRASSAPPRLPTP